MRIYYYYQLLNLGNLDAAARIPPTTKPPSGTAAMHDFLKKVSRSCRDQKGQIAIGWNQGRLPNAKIQLCPF